MGRKPLKPTTVTGRRLAKLIRLRRLTYEEVAAAAGVYPTTIYRLVGGKTRDPQPRTKRAIARALGVAPHRLFAREQRQFPVTRRESAIPTAELRQIVIGELLELSRLHPRSLGRCAATAIDAMHAALLGFGDQTAVLVFKPFALADDFGIRNVEQLSLRLDQAMRLLPHSAARLSARNAVDSILYLRLLLGEKPTPEMYAGITYLRRPRDVAIPA